MAGGLKLPNVRPVERNAVSTIHTPEKTENHPGRWKALGVLAAGLALIVMDGTIVGVALPTMISALDLSLTNA